MADDIAITAGAGTTVATDEVGGRHYQLVKQAFGVVDSATLVSPTNPLPVVVGQSQLWTDITMPGTSTTAYAINDQVGTLITISNAARATGKGGWINAIIWHDDDDVMGSLDFLFYNDTPTLQSDSAAFSLSDADARKLLYIGSMTYLTDLGAQRYGQLTGISVPYFCTATSLYVSVIARTAATLAVATSQRIRIALTLD